MKKIVMLLALAATVAGCSVSDYLPPNTEPVIDAGNIVVHDDFGTVWKRLISFSAENFFGLDHIEKESGIITLSFTGNPPSDFITGGTWDYHPLVKSSAFKSDYADYLATSFGGVLSGKANIFISETSPGKTMVKVKVRYVFSCPPNTWSFETGNSATQTVVTNNLGSKGQRTMSPRYTIEKMITDAAKGEK